MTVTKNTIIAEILNNDPRKPAAQAALHLIPVGRTGHTGLFQRAGAQVASQKHCGPRPSAKPQAGGTPS